MKNENKTVLVVLIIVIPLFAFDLWFCSNYDPLWQGKRNVERDFNKNKESILIVKDFMAELEYELIVIRPPNEKMFAGLGNGDISTSDERVKDAIKLLGKKGYYVIRKNSGCISFQKWGIKDKGIGAVYSINGSVPTESSLQFLTKAEQMAEDGWYYFEEDYNLIKTRMD